MSGKNKLHYSLLNWDFVEDMTKCMQKGAEKYDAFGWMDSEITDERISEYWDAAMRHMTKYVRGNVNDEEDGISHLTHAACNMMMLWYHETQAQKSKE